MDNDLTDVGLNALEALEAQDEQGTSEAESTENTSEEVESEQEGTEEAKDDGEEETSSSDEDESSEKSESEREEETKDDSESEEETKEEDKKELTDEEFEELAKKRGYTKAKAEDEKVEEDAKATRNSQAEVMERLLKCPKEVDEERWEQLPETNKIIYNSLPYITIKGKNGEEISIKTPEQIPDDFEFESEKAKATFYTNLQAQENNAAKMEQALKARAERAEADEMRRNEARRVISQVEELQKKGDLPTPKAKNGTDEFDKDPAVVLINKVLKYRAERAAGGDNLSVRDSYLLYKAEHPEDFAKKEAKGDVERKAVAKKVSGGSKGSGTTVNGGDKYKTEFYRPGMGTMDVLDLITDNMD